MKLSYPSPCFDKYSLCYDEATGIKTEHKNQTFSRNSDKQNPFNLEGNQRYQKTYQNWAERKKNVENRALKKGNVDKFDLTVSLVGARISSIIILSRAKELRLSVLDLSELKERRLQVTMQPSATGNNK